MPAIVLMLIAIVVTVVAYFTYGSFVARRLAISNDHETPAHTRADGVDYVAAPAPVVLGHHFASIAGAGPIVGPIVAVAFGWLPAFLWILVGVVFIGAVHDFTSLTASIRHGGRSIGDLIEQYVGVTGKRFFVLFALSALILVIGVFGFVVANTFVKTPAVATASILFIAFAVGFGLATNKAKVLFVPATVVGVFLLFACIAVGIRFPIDLAAMVGEEQAMTIWVCVLGVYIFIAAVTPVWILLQPRDYLNSYLLYAMMFGGIIGLFIARPSLQLPVFTSIHVDEAGYIFPILFVTVACGSISGFHSLVASGTTSKQIDRETDAKIVGYGGMLIEGVLAVLALIAAGMLTQQGYAEIGNPIAIFSSGVGGFMGALGIPEESAVIFVALSVSAFALTSLDTCTRLARFLFQELFSTAETEATGVAGNRYFATAVIVVLGAALTLSGQWRQVWPIFGSANQLLAALALLGVAVWMARRGIKNTFVLIPMGFMFAVTLAALAVLAYQNAIAGQWVLVIFATLLFALAIVLLVQSIGVLRAPPMEERAEAPAE